ncbi:hypothetical protein GCM10022221_64610 [Actinocorallia aurea]
MARFTYKTVGVVVGVVLAAGACTSSPGEAPPERKTGAPTADATVQAETNKFDLYTPGGQAHGREKYYFGELPSMTATADLVVRGKVVKVEAGEPEYDPGDPSGKPVLTARIVTLKVYEVYKAADAAPETVRVYEGHFNGDGVGIQYGNVTWTREGTSGLYFLDLNEKTGVYLLISSEGRVLFKDGRLESSAGDISPLHEEIEQMSREQVEEKVVKAVKDAEDGKIKPKQP